jgi:predicted metal-dependent hydrolase
VETLTFEYGDYKYDYYLVYQDRKTVSLTVQPSLNIILRCPDNYTDEKIEQFLKRKWHWLEAQIKDLKRFQRKTSAKEYVSGESFLYLGRQYQLIIKESATNGVRFEAGRIIVETTEAKNNKAHNKKLLQSWYDERANKVFKERYREVLKKFNYDFTPELALRKMEKR